MQHGDSVIQLELPASLTRLLKSGVWPSSDGPSMTAQELHPSISADRVRRFAAEESVICLHLPPFPTISQEIVRGAGDFWERFGALHQIEPSKALIIGDFGLGSDSPIILDYSPSMSNPRVLRLRWGAGGCTEWVEGAANFDEFAALLGLL